jgi:hypothetical protein
VTITCGTYVRPLEELPKERLRSYCIPLALHQNIEEMAVLVDRTLEVIALTVDRQKDFVQVPLVPSSEVPTPQLIDVCLSKLPAPIPHRSICEDDPTCRHQLLDIAIAQAKT